MQPKGKTVVLTGGQGGIGKILASLLESAGARVIIIDRQIGIDTWPTDLSDEKELLNLCQKLARQPVDILINLAGLMYFGHLHEQSPDQLAAMLRVNLEVPIRLSQAVIPGMLQRGKGQIVNIGSVFGSLAFPHFVTYSATKAGLKGFSEALRREYAGKGITVTHIAPRAVKTALNGGIIADLHERTGVINDSPEKVARIILKAIEKEQRNVTIGFPETIFTKINALLPGVIDNALTGKRDTANQLLNEQKEKTHAKVA
jgi:short-subunit dehydrogenase